MFCEACAIKAFSQGCICTVCNAELCDGQVEEFLIGISTGPVAKYMYQSTFQSNDWSHTLDNIHTVLKSTLELIVWSLHQLHFEASKNAGEASNIFFIDFLPITR